MRRFALIGCIALAACTPVSNVNVAAAITSSDMLVNRPGTTNQEALFRLQPDGTGTVDFTDRPSDPQNVSWALSGSTFCLGANEGLMASFGCAKITVINQQVTLSHTRSSSVATGVLVAR